MTTGGYYHDRSDGKGGYDNDNGGMAAMSRENEVTATEGQEREDATMTTRGYYNDSGGML